MKHYGKFYINGLWVEPIESRTFELINPTTEQPYATVALGGKADVDRAVEAARAALPAFSAQSKQQRVELVERIIEVYSARMGDISAALTVEMGAPRSLEHHVVAGLGALRQAVKTLKQYEFETRLGANIIRREPFGVAGLITAWNWPNQLICIKLSSAFAAGCTVVLKPSEYTPLSALIFAEIAEAAGVPKGAFNLVNGDGPTVGNAIAAHHGIDIVSFTGSTRAGSLVAEAAAPSIKRVAQELGGKSANIVLPDANLKAAAEFNVSRGFTNSAQSCHSPARLIVHEDQRDALLVHLEAAILRMRVGDPNDPNTTHGPVANRTQYENIQRYIQSGIDQGGRLVTGGLGRPPGLDRGYFIRPTVFADVRPEMTIAREEIFGMVTPVLTYKTIDEAIDIANDTPYGLAGYIFGENRDQCLDVCRKVKAGRVSINGSPIAQDAPMGGYKKSGNGRELGVFGLEEYLEVKAMVGFV
jgi:aldehyde dehydrogenase (NAD+)